MFRSCVKEIRRRSTPSIDARASAAPARTTEGAPLGARAMLMSFHFAPRRPPNALMTASRAEQSRARLRHGLEGLRAADLMTPDPVRGPGWLTVQSFLDDYVFAPHPAAFPIDAWSGGVSGVVTVKQLKSVPPALRGVRRALDVAWPLARVPIVRPEQPAIAVAALMAQGPSRRALVMDDDRLLGIISPADLASRHAADLHDDPRRRGPATDLVRRGSQNPT